MALDSPVISDQDSLIEQVPTQTGEHVTRGNTNYSTFTRKRPINLPNSLQKKKRQSLMSPQSIPNLDSDDLLTPDFAMTQSMYEPLEKRKQQAKLEANSKLLSLLASEKISQAAKQRKEKEIRKRATEQKKRNEEKQKLAEERRLRMLADQEAKKKRILEKINLPSPMTASCYGNMNRSVIKQRVSIGSGFIEKRPVSSTGKIFGFGSSATRDVCENFNSKKSKDKDPYYVEYKKQDQITSRMCASQIIINSNYSKENKTHKNLKENSIKPISVSTFNISNFNKSLIKSKKTSSNTKNENAHNRINLLTPAIPEMKLIRIHSNINGISKTSPVLNQKNTYVVKKSRARSTEKEKIIPNIAVHTEPRSRTVERKKTPAKHVALAPANVIPNHKSINKSQNIKNVKPHDEPISSIKKPLFENESRHRVPSGSKTQESDAPRKSEVRFEEKENIKDTDSNLLSESSISTERRRTSNNNLTEDEYKQRIALQRRLAKEKRKKEQEEKELQLSKEQNEIYISQEAQKPEIINVETKEEILEKIETNISIDESDSNQSSKRETEELTSPKINDNDVSIKKLEVNDSSSASINENIPTIKIPEIETPSVSIEMSTSTEMLDRIERKKRIESIMSRIKKPIGGSTENVTHHISTTTLQDMMNKGHLSGMSKTAAILMRNSHVSTEFSASSIDLHTTEEHIKSNSSIDINPKSSDKTENTQESRGSCDGQEDVIIPTNFEENLTTKSNLMGNLVSNSNKPYFSSWQGKYSDSCSLDADDDNT